MSAFECLLLLLDAVKFTTQAQITLLLLSLTSYHLLEQIFDKDGQVGRRFLATTAGGRSLRRWRHGAMPERESGRRGVSPGVESRVMSSLFVLRFYRRQNEESSFTMTLLSVSSKVSADDT